MTLPANGFPATPLTEHSAAITSKNLNGQLDLLYSMLVANHTLFFFTEYVFFTILTYDCNYFDAVRIPNYHLNTFRTTTCSPQHFSCTPEYVKKSYHYLVQISSENEMY